LGNIENEDIIVLLEVRVMPELPIRAEIEPLEILIDILSASVYAICEELKKIAVL